LINLVFVFHYIYIWSDKSQDSMIITIIAAIITIIIKIAIYLKNSNFISVHPLK